jgi:hypothetical protein
VRTFLQTMKKIFFLLMCIIIIHVSCKKNDNVNNFIKSTVNTIDESYETLYFDDDHIKDKVEIKAKQNIELSNFVLSINLSSLNKTLEIPIINNSILYNNTESDYYISDPIIKNKIIELTIDYADQTTKPNISGDKKNLTEKIKFRYNSENKKVQITGYDLNYIKNKNRKYTKSFNFITGKYSASYLFGKEKRDTSGWALELQNIYTDDWNRDFLNKILFYGNEAE